MAVGASKSQLLEWINTRFDAGYTKIEQCGTGAVYCLIFDALYPNTINTSKVNINPKTDFQILNNYKLLQHGFNKARPKITRDVNVERLMKCRLQDNLEFMQWFGRLWCDNHKDFSFGSGNGSRESSTPPGSGSAAARRESTVKPTVKAPKATVKTTAPSAPSPAPSPEPASLATLRQQLDDVTAFKDGLEIERNFYFNKLRDIEILCQDIQTTGNASGVDTLTLVSDIMEIMYQTEDGFLLPEGEDVDGTPQRGSSVPGVPGVASPAASPDLFDDETF